MTDDISEQCHERRMALYKLAAEGTTSGTMTFRGSLKALHASLDAIESYFRSDNTCPVCGMARDRNSLLAELKNHGLGGDKVDWRKDAARYLTEKRRRW